MHARQRSEPTAEEMDALAKAALQALPETFREHLRDIVIQVEDFATREQLDSVEIEDKWSLSGLYEGRPLSEQSVWDPSDLPPIVTLFRRPLIAEWEDTGVRLDDLVRHVVVHEIGHHFGFSDDDMHALEDGAD